MERDLCCHKLFYHPPRWEDFWERFLVQGATWRREALPPQKLWARSHTSPRERGTGKALKSTKRSAFKRCDKATQLNFKIQTGTFTSLAVSAQFKWVQSLFQRAWYSNSSAQVKSSNKNTTAIQKRCVHLLSQECQPVWGPLPPSGLL